jgi:uncharacterized protein involved in outer membrane biogenesis
LRAILAAARGRMSRRLRLWLIVGGSVVVLGGGFLWALPEIVRRTVVTQFPKLTGRAVSIEDIDLNLFTGRLVLKKLAIAERDPSETFLQAERIALRLSPFSLIVGHLRLSEMTFTAPRIRIVRTGPVEFNFSDLLAQLPPADPNQPKSRFTVSIVHLALVDGAVMISDRAVSPSRDWNIQGITIEAGGLTTRAAQQPGHLDVRGRVNDAPLDANAGSVVLTPVGLTLHLSLNRFDLTQVRPYLPPGLPISLASGTLGLDLELTLERGEEGLKRTTVSGDVRVEGLALAQPDHPAPFVKLPRLTIAIESADLIARSITLKSVDLDALDLRAARDQAGNLDLLALAGTPAEAAARAGPAPAPGPAASAPRAAGALPFKVKLERLSVRSGTVALNDQAVSPAREWRLSGLTIDGAGFSTAPEDAPGTLKVSAQLDMTSGHPPATVSLDAASLRLLPLAATARVALDRFDLGALGPYWPAALPAVVRDGSLGVTVDAAVEQNDATLTRAVASGNVRLTGLTLVRRGQSSTPFLTVPKLTVGLKQADAMARTVALASIAIDGVDARAVRDAAGQIDLLEILAAAPAATGAPAPASASKTKPLTRPAPAPPEWRINLDRFDFTKGRATFEDRAVSPTTSLAVTDLTVSAERVTWPSTTPATFAASMTMPGGGRTEIKGKGRLDPLDVQIAMSTRDAPIEPYQAYFPFPARFVGFFSGDSLSEIQRAKNGTLILASRGQASARDFLVREPGVDAPVVKLSRLQIEGLDFSWPNYALIDRVVFTKPEVQAERDSNGVMNLQRLFAPTGAQAAKSPPGSPAPEPPVVAKPAAGASSGAPPASGGLLQEIVLDCSEITLVDGYVRFLDRTTTPAFSEALSALAVTIRGASNHVGRHPTSATVSAKIGDGALEVQGQFSGAGAGLRADLAGNLQDFALPDANPYVDKLSAWIIDRGTFSLKFHYQLEGDRLDADHDMKFAGLRVQRSKTPGEAPQRLGVPLGLAVALLKDRHGNIDFSIPLHGTLSDRNFDWSEAMWAGARQVIVKLIVSPFNVIGRAVTGGEDKIEKLEVAPVTFASASPVIAPPMEAHLTKVGDFLRRAPSITLTLTPAVSAADLEGLKEQELNARVAQLQRERGLRDLSEAFRAYAKERLPGEKLPERVEEQFALLKSREPVPAGPLENLLKSRTDATRERLVKAEGIPAERLTVSIPSASAAASAASGEGRVEFGIGAADQ